MIFEVETPEGTSRVDIDPTSSLGEITPAEFGLMTRYATRSGLDHEQAWAGAHLLCLLSREVDVDPDALLEAVL